MRYHIIRDLDSLNEFVSSLPELYFGEKYFIRLITRSKYVDSVKTDKDLRSILVDRDGIVNGIQQLECDIGLYDGLGDDEIGIYMSPNPRDMELVVRNVLLRFSKIIVGGYRGEDVNNVITQVIRGSCKRQRQMYYDLDFDIKGGCSVDLIVDQVGRLINRECLRVLHTKMGIHFIVELGRVDNISYPNWLGDISKLSCFDSQCMSDNNIPIVGCSQFGFVPYFTIL